MELLDFVEEQKDKIMEYDQIIILIFYKKYFIDFMVFMD